MYRATLFFITFAAMSPVCCLQRMAYSSAAPDKDGYALYSSIYRSSNSIAPDEVLAIAAEPLILSAMPGIASCLTPSTDEERRMVDAANTLRTNKGQWKRRFDIGNAYLLIPPGEINNAIGCVSSHGRQSSGGHCDAYAHVRFVRFLSIPIFNRDHTRALLGIDKACGGLCGNGDTRVYRKTREGWKVEANSFARCSFVS